MTVAVVKDGAEHPLLGARVPVGPSVAADIVAAAGSADNLDGHCVLLPSSGVRQDISRYVPLGAAS